VLSQDCFYSINAANSQMKKCDYCGKENEAALSFCHSCGTSLVEQEEKLPAVPGTRGEELKGWPAFVILLVYIASQTFVSGIAGGIGLAIAAAHGHDLHTAAEIKRVLQDLMPVLVVSALLGGGAGMFVMALVLVPRWLRDTSPTGAAWVRGSWNDVSKGLALGMIVGFASWAFITYLSKTYGAPRSLGPIARMVATPGSGLAVWAICLLTIAPMVEEPLFRGLFYGGLRKSLGPVPAGTISTAAFILLHGSEIIHFTPATLPLALLSVCALWMRLRFMAIGPPIAVHFGYNAILVLAAYRSLA